MSTVGRSIEVSAASRIAVQAVYRWGGLATIAAACLFGEVLVRLEEGLSHWWGTLPTSEPGAER